MPIHPVSLVSLGRKTRLPSPIPHPRRSTPAFVCIRVHSWFPSRDLTPTASCAPVSGRAPWRWPILDIVEGDLPKVKNCRRPAVRATAEADFSTNRKRPHHLSDRSTTVLPEAGNASGANSAFLRRADPAQRSRNRALTPDCEYRSRSPRSPSRRRFSPACGRTLEAWP